MQFNTGKRPHFAPVMSCDWLDYVGKCAVSKVKIVLNRRVTLGQQDEHLLEEA
jgi:predicted secreted Zn-dependent protease